MNRAAEHSQLREYLDAGLQGPITKAEPIAKGGIRIDAASRLEALLWKLRISLLFVGADITTRQ